MVYTNATSLNNKILELELYLRFTNIYALYKSEVGQNPVGRPKETYLDQISKYVSADKRIKLTGDEIARKARDKGEV